MGHFLFSTLHHELKHLFTDMDVHHYDERVHICADPEEIFCLLYQSIMRDTDRLL